MKLTHPNNESPKDKEVQKAKQKQQTQSTRAKKDGDKPETDIQLRRWIPWAIGAFIICLLIILFALLRNFNSPEAQARILTNAISNNDTQKIATVLSTKRNKVGEDEASAYIKYIKKYVGMKQFEKDIKQTIDQLEDDKAVAQKISDKKGNDVLRVSKNGRRYLIFDNLSFQAPEKKAVLKPKMAATYKFKSNGQQKTVVADTKELVTLGHYIPGEYEVETTRETDKGTFDGTLNFNFNNSNSETVDVTEDFKEAYLDIQLEGASKLKGDSIKVKINGESERYKKDKRFGPYPVNDEITISAKGTAKDKSYTSNTVTLKPESLKATTEVRLKFDGDEIAEYVEKKEKEENSIRAKLSNFFSNYFVTANAATTSKNFDGVSRYLKKDSEAYDKVKRFIESENKKIYNQIEIVEVNTGDDNRHHVTIKATDQTGKQNLIAFDVEDDKDGDFKILKSNDK